MSLEARLQAAEASGLVGCWLYTERKATPGFHEAPIVLVRCKGCGTPIRRLRLRRDGVRLLDVLPAFDEVVLETTDGGRHVTPVCRSCADPGPSPDVATAWLLADVASWLRGHPDPSPAMRAAFETAAQRTVEAVRRPRAETESAMYRAGG